MDNDDDQNENENQITGVNDEIQIPGVGEEIAHEDEIAEDDDIADKDEISEAYDKTNDSIEDKILEADNTNYNNTDADENIDANENPSVNKNNYIWTSHLFYSLVYDYFGVQSLQSTVTVLTTF